MNAIKFLPWRGDHYEGGFQGRRVLVLGESHYHSEGEFINDDADITKKVVSLQFDGSGTTYRFFTPPVLPHLTLLPVASSGRLPSPSALRPDDGCTQTDINALSCK